MRFNLNIFLLFVFCFGNSISLFSQTFNEHFGVFDIGWADFGYDVEYVNDSIYIIVTDQNPTGGSRLCVSNISLTGDLVWFKCLERDTTIRGGGSNSLDANLDHSRYVQGQTFETVHPGTEESLYLNELVMFDQNFDTLFTTLVGDSINFFRARQAKFTPDGGAVMVGWTHTLEPEEGPINLFIAKFDENGNEEWQKIHSTSPGSWDLGFSIEALDNGNYIVGSTTEPGWGSPNWPVITLFDNVGNYIDHREFGNNQFFEGWASVTALADGDFVFCASKQDSFDDDRYYIVKFNEDLDVIWEKDYYFYSAEVAMVQIKENEDGTLIACGTWEDKVTTHDFGVLLKLDSNGELLWHRLYQHANEGFFQINRLYDVVPIPDDGGYVACGERNGPDNGQNYWVLKVDSLGCLVEGCDTITSIEDIKELEQIEFITGPNPATDYLNVFLPDIPAKFKSSPFSLELRNTEGKTVERVSIMNYNTTIILDVKNHPRGIYLLSLVSGGRELTTQKIIIE